jgi:hypothetical protein
MPSSNARAFGFGTSLNGWRVGDLPETLDRHREFCSVSRHDFGGRSLAHIPVGIMAYRFCQLVPEGSKLEHFERRYAAISARPVFKDHLSAIALV